MTPKQQYYETIADNLIKKFNLRGIEGYYCSSSEEALGTIKRFLTPDCSVTWGGSETLKEIGLLNALKNSDYIVYDRAEAKTPEEKSQLYAKAVTADYFFMSSNAITLDGELVNIDGNGNRTACLMCGPKNVVVVAGMNKLAPDVSSAIARAKNIAAPPNAMRLSCSTPCSDIGRCVNCLTDDCICCNTVVTRRSRIPGRIKVILIGEELGY